ncbi:sigma-70 family RNA polymerase sigma factor [Prauserella muralis]|uniref:RNA polymerase sigma-70 factor (ECF subfamily) n=1 Tax=Prauserella muralis TaxID=588067 RepID=A0A2V4AQZ1_9PSEU|nr:sigma-70 family RNA polymerase sigma factor [Prauserella muralis]PXY22963.1 hypothetical protein BAY60_22485 [Prauserella muralis]
MAASGGDDPAAEELLRRIRPAMVRYCRARIGRTGGTFASADDVAQDACLGIFLALRGYRPQGRSFLAFAYRVAANKVVDHYRKAGSNREACFAEPPESAAPGGGVAFDPEQRCLDKELTEQMRLLLRRVSDRERDVLILRLVVGLSGAETARAVNMTPGAVRVAQHRAVTKLRTMLDH